MSMAEELEKLASLRERGILTDEEFQAQKKKLLGVQEDAPIVSEPVTAMPIDQSSDAQAPSNNRAVDSQWTSETTLGLIGLILIGAGLWYGGTWAYSALMGDDQSDSSEAQESNSPKAILDNYWLNNGSGSYTVRDAYDKSVRYIVKFSNGNMRVTDGGTVMYDGKASINSDFDRECVGGEKVLFGIKSGSYLCYAVNSFSETGQSYSGEKYQFNAQQNELFFWSPNYGQETENFPGDKVSREVNGTFYGLVK